MKKTFVPFVLSIALTLAFVSISHSGSVISNISNRPYRDESPHLNNNGEVVWSGYDGTDWEIFLYDGTKTVQLTDNAYDDLYPQISDNGYVVWVGHVVWEGKETDNSEIFLYNGADVIQLTNTPGRDYEPRINNKGHVVWWGADGSGSEIYLYDGTTTIQLTDTSYYNVSPEINDSDYVAWYGFVGGYQVYLYDGSSIIQLADYPYHIQYPNNPPQINESGQVMWQGYDPQGQDYEIFLYDGTTTIQLTNNFYHDSNPQLNNKGQVVWHMSEGEELGSEIYFYDGINTIKLTGNTYSDFDPQINDSGHVVWCGLDDTGTHIFFYDGRSISQLTNNSFDSEESPQINNNDYLVWVQWANSDYEIILRSNPVKVIAPNGGEVLMPGDTYTVQWWGSKKVRSFKLEHSADSGATWNLLANRYTDTSFKWEVPKPPTNRTKCLMRVVGYDENGIRVNSDRSDYFFSTEVVKLISPNTYVTYTSGDAITITWATHATKKPVARTFLYYTKDGGITWNLIRSLKGDPDPRSFEWIVPSVKKVKPSSKIKVVLKDANGNNLGSDASDSYFVISPQ